MKESALRNESAPGNGNLRKSSEPQKQAAKEQTLTCAVCSQPITDLVYARCAKCGNTYHVVCLKKRPAIDICRHYNLELCRQKDMKADGN